MPGLGLLDHSSGEAVRPNEQQLAGAQQQRAAGPGADRRVEVRRLLHAVFPRRAAEHSGLDAGSGADGGGYPHADLFKVTLPLLRPTLSFVITTALIYSITQIDHVAVMTRGGPDNATTVLLYYIQNLAWDTHDLGKASAATFLTLAGLFAFSLINLKLLEKGAHYER